MAGGGGEMKEEEEEEDGWMDGCFGRRGTSRPAQLDSSATALGCDDGSSACSVAVLNSRRRRCAALQAVGRSSRRHAPR